MHRKKVSKPKLTDYTYEYASKSLEYDVFVFPTLINAYVVQT